MPMFEFKDQKNAIGRAYGRSLSRGAASIGGTSCGFLIGVRLADEDRFFRDAV